MGALGDSITAGMLANYRRQSIMYPWNTLRLVWDALSILATPAGKERVEKRELSWSTGFDPKERVFSHGARLARLSGLSRIKAYNSAVSGETSLDVVNTQLPELGEWSRMELGQAYPDYVTLLIGPNDICAKTVEEMVPVDDYYWNIVRVVDEVLSKSPKSRILLSSIPDVEKLRNIAKDAHLHSGMKCSRLWSTAHVCPTLTSLSDPAGRALVKQRVDQYNEALKDVARSRSAYYGDRVRYGWHTFETDYNPNDLSIDCFHPNPSGQEKLAESTWADSWWTQEWAKKLKTLKVSKARKFEQSCRAKLAAAPVMEDGARAPGVPAECYDE
jgi:lysophospholipase L1-like esterase